jgi:hypothetical protein
MEVSLPSINKTKVISSFIKAKKEFKPVKLDKINPHFKSKFASLESIAASTEEQLLKYGIIPCQPWEGMPNGDVILFTKLIHESGEELSSSVVIPRGTKTDQQLGASITYQRRYQLSSILCIVGEEEDDGESGEGRVNPAVQYQSKEEKKTFEKREYPDGKKISPKQAEWLLKELNILGDPEHFKLILKTYDISAIEDLDMNHFGVVMEGVKEKQKNKSRVA